MTYYTKVNNEKNYIGLSMSIVEVYGVVVKTHAGPWIWRVRVRIPVSAYYSVLFPSYML